MGPLSPYIAGHIALHGSRLLHGQEDLWKATWRSDGRFACEFGYLGNVYECHSSRAAVHLGKDCATNLRCVKNYQWQTTGQLFRETEKADQWSDRNHWHKPEVPRFKAGIGKLIAQRSL